MRRVLVLRPEPGASATVEKARWRGLDAIAIPLFEIEPVGWTAPAAEGFDALLLTSVNAVRHGGDQLHGLRRLPVHAVGAATADAARQAGFEVAGRGDSGIDRLLGSIVPDLKLLHLAGEDRRAPLDVRQQITTITVYRARIRDPIEFGDIENCIALAHSPRAARRFAQLVGKARSSIMIAAISRETADAAGPGWSLVEVADEPSDEALLVLAERLCNKAPAK